MMTIAASPLVDTTTSPYQEIVTDDEQEAFSSLSKAAESYRSGECNGTTDSKRAHSIGSNHTVETSDLTLPTVTSRCNLVNENNNDDEGNDNSTNFYHDFFEMSSNTSSDDEFRFIIEDTGTPPIMETEELMTCVDDDNDDTVFDDDHCDVSTQPPPVRLDEQVAVTAFMTTIPPSNGNRSSIVKPYDFNDKLIKNSGWKNLPKLDCVSIGLRNKKMNVLRKEQTETAASRRRQALSVTKPTTISPASSTESSTTTKNKKNKKTRSPTVVSFGFIALRNYDQTIGDNPSVSYGTPIQLDWEYEELGLLINVDDYELGRSTRRSAHQMMLNYYQRRNILQYWYGHSEKELDSAEKHANGLKFQRSITKMFLPYAFVEDAATSVVRKAKRRLNPLNSSPVAATTSPVRSSVTTSRKFSPTLTKSSSESAISTQFDRSVPHDIVQTTSTPRHTNDDTTTSSNSVGTPISIPVTAIAMQDNNESNMIEC